MLWHAPTGDISNLPNVLDCNKKPNAWSSDVSVHSEPLTGPGMPITFNGSATTNFGGCRGRFIALFPASDYLADNLDGGSQVDEKQGHVGRRLKTEPDTDMQLYYQR